MHYINSIIIRICTLIHLVVIKVLYFNSFNFKGISVIHNNSHFRILDDGKIILGKHVGIRRNCEIAVSEEGIIDIGDNVFINNNCMLISHCKIHVGEGTRLGPQVMIFDHDYDYKNRVAFKKGIHNSSPIVIGKNCWIGAGTIILKGSKIGNNCVVGAGSVIKGNYKDNSIIIQRKQETVSTIILKGSDNYEKSIADCR